MFKKLVVSEMPAKSNFECVNDFVRDFGQPYRDTVYADVFDKDPKMVNFRMGLIDEEVKELEEAIAANDMVECVDALADILYVVYGAGSVFGLNLDQGYQLVHTANMTKFCATEEEAKETVKMYEEKYAAGKTTYATPDYKKSSCGNYFVVYNRDTQKTLKSCKWAQHTFTDFLAGKAVEVDTKLTNFEKAALFTKTGGQKFYTTPQSGALFESDPQLVKQRVALIKEEQEELREAIKQKDMVETLDALCDILYVVYGAGFCFGVDLDESFRLVHESNMTKLCKTEDEAKETVAWYKANYDSEKRPYTSPAYRMSDSGAYYVVFNDSDDNKKGKILKSIKYKAVDLKPMVGSQVIMGA